MNIKIRRIILAIFLLFFFITAPILILYTSGYRFNLKKFELIKTGSLFIETPTIKNTEIYVNDKLYKYKLNKKIFIKNLLPNKYKISLIKKGRYPWEKEIIIHPSITTFIKNVLLFSKSKPTLEYQSNQITTSKISPNKENLAFIEKSNETQDFYIFNTKNLKETKVYSLNKKTKPIIQWSKNSKKLLISSNEDNVIIKSSKDIDSISLKDTNYNSIKWDLSNESLTILYPHKISNYNIDTRIAKDILTSKNIIQDVLSDSSNYFYIENTEDESLLKQHNSTFDSTILIAKLPKSDNYSFIDLTNHFVLLKNQNSSKIILIKRPQEFNFLDLQNNIMQFDAKGAVFDSEKQKLLLYNNFELKSYNIEEKKLTLIDRYGKEIKTAIWHTDNKHILIEFNDSITVSDLSSNTKTSKIELAKDINNLNSLNIINSQYLIFTAKNSNAEGIYLLQID